MRGSWIFNSLEFKITGAPPWNFPPARICLSLSNLVKAPHPLSELRYSTLEYARVQASAVPTDDDGSKSSLSVGCFAVFSYLDLFTSLPLVASIFTA